jgi:hypothetical protein
MSLCIAYGKLIGLEDFNQHHCARMHSLSLIILYICTVVRLVHLKGRISALQIVVRNLLSVKRSVQLLYIVGFRLPHYVRPPSCGECAPRGLTLVL